MHCYYATPAACSPFFCIPCARSCVFSKSCSTCPSVWNTSCSRPCTPCRPCPPKREKLFNINDGVPNTTPPDRKVANQRKQENTKDKGKVLKVVKVERGKDEDGKPKDKSKVKENSGGPKEPTSQGRLVGNKDDSKGREGNKLDHPVESVIMGKTFEPPRKTDSGRIIGKPDDSSKIIGKRDNPSGKTEEGAGKQEPLQGTNVDNRTSTCTPRPGCRCPHQRMDQNQVCTPRVRFNQAISYRPRTVQYTPERHYRSYMSMDQPRPEHGTVCGTCGRDKFPGTGRPASAAQQICSKYLGNNPNAQDKFGMDPYLMPPMPNQNRDWARCGTCGTLKAGNRFADSEEDKCCICGMKKASRAGTPIIGKRRGPSIGQKFCLSLQMNPKASAYNNRSGFPESNIYHPLGAKNQPNPFCNRRNQLETSKTFCDSKGDIVTIQTKHNQEFSYHLSNIRDCKCKIK